MRSGPRARTGASWKAAAILAGLTALAALFILLQSGARKRDRDLYDAVARSDSDAVGRLIARGASIDSTGPTGVSVLKNAVLIDGRRPGSGMTASGRSPAYSPDMTAISERAGQCLHEILVAQCRSLHTEADMRSVWFPAARSGFNDVLKICLDKGIKVDLKTDGTEGVDEPGKTALHLAASEPRTETVQFLLDHGADANVLDGHGENCLLAAFVTVPDTSTITSLIRHHAAINIRGRGGMTPLMWAVNRNQSGATAALLDAGAQMNVADARGNYPLDIAVMRSLISGDQKMVRVLLAHGAAHGQRFDRSATEAKAEEFIRSNPGCASNWTRLRSTLRSGMRGSSVG